MGIFTLYNLMKCFKVLISEDAKCFLIRNTIFRRSDKITHAHLTNFERFIMRNMLQLATKDIQL